MNFAADLLTELTRYTNISKCSMYSSCKKSSLLSGLYYSQKNNVIHYFKVEGEVVLLKQDMWGENGTESVCLFFNHQA